MSEIISEHPHAGVEERGFSSPSLHPNLWKGLEPLWLALGSNTGQQVNKEVRQVDSFITS